MSSTSQGPPYIPQIATLGMHPNVSQDVAPCAVYIAIYLGSAIAHHTTFLKNHKHGQWFPMSLAMGGFGMARVGTLALRLAWACKQDDASLAIAALIFINVGGLILYVIFVILSLRLFRARQPRMGWNPYLRTGVKISYILLAILVALVVTFTVLSFYTTNKELLNASKWIQRASGLYYLVFNIFAAILYLLAVFLPAASNAENFGKGSMETKLLVLGVCLFFDLFIVGFRTGIAWTNPRPLSDPVWFDSRAAFYIIDLGFEIFITYFLFFTHFDQRFWIPNGSKKPGDYSRIDPSDPERRRLKVYELKEVQVELATAGSET